MNKDIHNSGSPQSQVWVIVETPLAADQDKGFLYSCNLGYVFIKMMQEAGFSRNDYYIASRRPHLDIPDSYVIIENELNHYKPPVIIALGNSAWFLSKDIRAASKSKGKGRKSAKVLAGLETEIVEETPLDKYAGSLLFSSDLSYPHYIIPSYPPEDIVRSWDQRDIVISFDLAKAKAELDWFRAKGSLRPLPERKLLYDLQYPEVLSLLDSFKQFSHLSVDIESIYTRKTSQFYPHPGYHTCVGLAPSAELGISFPLFWDDPQKSLAVWRKLNTLFSNPKLTIIGQNFFQFDTPRFNMLGFDIDYNRISDTLIRHYILYPSFPHKLQFLTRQYTREPFYKEEGANWSIKDMLGLRKYNCKDVCCTFEIWNEQEKELKQRGLE